jgi:pimeloyl-ACP methyl ester carboxylesterase
VTRSEPIGSGTIVYNQAGRGPSILLLHGLFAAKEQWNALVCRVAAAGYTAIAVDLPGYGKSQGYSLQDYRLGHQVERLHQFAARLKLVRLDIAGSSMGGTIASLYADRYPRQVRSLAFIGSPLGIVEWGQGIRKALYRGINPFIPINGDQFDLELRLLFVNPPEIPAPEKKAIVADYVTRNRHYVQVWDIVNLYDDVLRQPPPSVLPTLIVWGVEDRIYDIAGADALHRAIPGSELHRLPNAGHLLLMENAGEAASIYLAFLRSCRMFEHTQSVPEQAPRR